MNRFTSRTFGWLALALICACGGKASNLSTLGGETHFLQRCVDTCEGDLACIGNVCTKSCSVAGGANQCAGLGSTGQVRCTAQSLLSASVELPDSTPSSAAICDAACSEDIQCANLGSDYQCDNGFCREAQQGSTANDNVDELDAASCEMFENQPPALGVTITIRNLTGAPIYFEPNANCAGVISPVSIVDESLRTLSVLPPDCMQSCDEAMTNGSQQLACIAGCRLVLPYKLSNGVYRVTETDSLFATVGLSNQCGGTDSAMASLCHQGVGWPSGLLTLSARAYRAIDCEQPEQCDCRIPGSDADPGDPSPECEVGVLEQAGLFEASITTTYEEIAATGLVEVVFAAEDN